MFNGDAKVPLIRSIVHERHHFAYLKSSKNGSVATNRLLSRELFIPKSGHLSPFVLICFTSPSTSGRANLTRAGVACLGLFDYQDLIEEPSCTRGWLLACCPVARRYAPANRGPQRGAGNRHVAGRARDIP